MHTGMRSFIFSWGKDSDMARTKLIADIPVRMLNLSVIGLRRIVQPCIPAIEAELAQSSEGYTASVFSDERSLRSTIDTSQFDYNQLFSHRGPRQRTFSSHRQIFANGFTKWIPESTKFNGFVSIRRLLPATELRLGTRISTEATSGLPCRYGIAERGTRPFTCRVAQDQVITNFGSRLEGYPAP